jgi:hypothetical protein
VVSAAPGGGTGTLHKLQLVSGRLLRSVPIAEPHAPVSLVDVAVTAAGAVLVLDAAGQQLLVLRPGATAFDRVLKLEVAEPVSLTAAADEGIAYVAHRDGISRIDLRARTVTPLAAPASVPLDRVERIRWHAHALIAVRADRDAARRITRLDLNASGRGVAHATMLDPVIPPGGPVYVTFSGDELVYLADRPKPADGAPIDQPRPGEFVAYRLRIR